MKNLTSFFQTMRRLRNWLAVVVWLFAAPTIRATTVDITDHTPVDILPGWTAVSLDVTVGGVVIDYIWNDVPKPLTITVTGALVDGVTADSYYNDSSRCYNFYIYDYTGDVTVTVECDGDSECFVIAYAEVSSIVARMHQLDSDTPVTEANFDQDVYFKAVTTPDPPPASLLNSFSWYGAEAIANSQWAKRTTDHTPGRPWVTAALGNEPEGCQVAMVKVTLTSWKCAGTSFREIMKDPPNQTEKFGGTVVDANNVTNQLPHWSEGADPFPVLYQVGQTLNLRPKFSVEPADWTGPITYRGSGGYNFDDDTQTRSANADFEPPAKDANSSLPADVGHEEGGITWVFKVGESDMSPAGMGSYDIYRAFSANNTDIITVVDVACKDVGGNTKDLVSAAVCTKFAGKSISKYKGGQLTYWKNGVQGAIGYSDMISSGDGNGNCDAWASFCVQALKLHDVSAEKTTMRPKRKIGNFPGYPDPLFPGKELIGKSLTVVAREGQGNLTPPTSFQHHAGVVFRKTTGPQNFFDPSYGLGPFGHHILWEDAVLSSIIALRLAPYGDVTIPNSPGIQDTVITPFMAP